MKRLDPIDRDLLDFLCACRHHKCRVVAVKAARKAALRRLRYAGLVSLEGYEPSASALADWRERKIIESPPSPGGAAGEEQPTPKAADAEGGAAARIVAAPPIAETFKCGHPRTLENTRICGRYRGAACMTCWREALSAGQLKRQERKRKALEAPLRPFDPEPAHHVPADRQERANARRGAAIRRTVSEKARQRIEQGLDARSCSHASVRHAQFAIEEENERQARLSTPIEVAKSKLQRRYQPVVSMAVYCGDPGLFIVGSKRNVTEAELLAMARRIAA